MTLKRMTLRKMTPQNNIQQSVVQPVTLGNAESKPYHFASVECHSEESFSVVCHGAAVTLGSFTRLITLS
jgi:hypothetical protein